MKIVSIIGARPQIIKVAEFCRHTDADRDVQHIILHTGQHYDEAMSQSHIDDLHVPEPDRNLGIKGGNDTENIALMMLGIDRSLREWAPVDLVVVYGDTNSTLAGAIAANKAGIPIAHMEAGVRSGDPRMQEERNRILVDSIAELHLFPSKCNGHHPLQAWQTGVFVGDLMLDSLMRHKSDYTWKDGEAVRIAGIPDPLTKRDYYYMTLHRAENVDNRDNLNTIMNAIGGHLDHPVYLAAHPRLMDRLNKFKVPLPPGIFFIPPQRYVANLKLMAGAKKILTDSGGMQKEAFWLKTPCITLRDSTEWPETLPFDKNILTPIDKERIRHAIKMFQTLNPSQDPGIMFGGGLAGSTALRVIKEFIRGLNV